jgi:hypothetical protein
MKALSQALIVCLLAAAVQSQASVSFCDLVRSPEKYDGKVVSIRATYRYGFEWQQLYCIDCLDRGKAWLEIPPDLDNTSDKALRRAPKGAGIVNLTVQGVFVSGGRLGHMNGCPYKFVVHKVRDVAVVLKGMRELAEEEKAEKQWACGGSNPK